MSDHTTFNRKAFEEKLEELITKGCDATKSDINEIVAKSLPELPGNVAHAGSKIIFEIIEDNIVHGNRIEIRGFGSWSIRYRPPRNAHNPRNGQKVTTLGKFRPHFKAGMSLKERIDSIKTSKIDLSKLTETRETEEA